jgi:predicted tellurium resistance membrane protein TerC
MDLLLDWRMWAAMIAIVAIESVLGIDNLVYLALLTDRQPQVRRALTEQLGLVVALACRLALLGLVVLLADLIQPVFTIFGQAFSWRDLTLVTGGLMLLVKGTQEIHGVVEGPTEDLSAAPPGDAASATAGLQWAGIAQMLVINMSFALDSIGTAFALSGNAWVMLAALVVSSALLMATAGPLSSFLTRHPTVRVLAMSYLLMLGLVLVAQGMGYLVPKEYILFALGLSAAVIAMEITLHKPGQEPRAKG